MAEKRPQCCRAGGASPQAQRLRRGETTGDEADGSTLDIAFDPVTGGEAQARHRLQPQLGIEQLGAVDEVLR